MKKWSYLILIILLAIFLRLYQLGTNPPSLTWDEVSWGYNAYSLGIDGRDEFGRYLPYDYLESFGDFKPPVYAYLSIIPVKIFGLNEFSTRFASAFFGVLTVLVSYFLAKNLFPQHKNLPAFTSIFLAISPWHIMLSRAAFEANISTFFIVTGVWLFLEAINRKPYLLLLSVTSFVASIYTFNSARIVAPLLLITLTLAFSKKILVSKRYLTVSIVLGLILVLPITKFLLSPQASLRFREVNIFSDIELLRVANQEVVNDNNAWWSKIIHNRRIVYGREFIEHYFDNLNPKFLFTRGDENPKFSTKDVGQMYLWDLSFLITGLIFLVRRREKNWWIAPVWLLIGIIPAAFARETPHALRTEGSLPTFQIITAYGFFIFLSYINQIKNQLSKFRKVFVCFAILILFGNGLYFLHGYYLHYSSEESGEWQYGYEETIDYVSTIEGKYDKIIFSKYLGRPYNYTLFYSKYDPKKFRQEADIRRDNFGFVHVEGYGKYRFPDIYPSVDPTKGKTLFVNNPEMVPVGAKVLKTFYLLNNKPVFSVYTL